MARFIRSGPLGKALVLSIWGGLIFAAMVGLVDFQMRPAAVAGTAPQQWPGGTNVSRDSERFTLVMTLHPQCECSVASVHELAVLMARSGDRLAARVLFIEPKGAPKGWLHGDLWNDASAIPGVRVAIDKDGKDAAAFGATTSGDVTVYDAAGRLVFKGGITDGRGHEGDNDGLDAILDAVRTGKAAVRQTPVYGCSLVSPSPIVKSEKAP